MPKPTERAVKRKPMAVVMLTCERTSYGEVPPEGRDFEWFETEENREKFFDQVNNFNQDDAKSHNDFAYLTAVITDTATMKLGRVEVAPANAETRKWKAEVKKDPSLLLMPVEKKDDTDKAPAKKAVKARGASKAAQAVAKGGTGDGAPKPRTVRKPAAKKTAAGPAKKAETPAHKAADLRRKLAAKTGKTQAEAEADALDAALAAADKAPAKKAPAKRAAAKKS